MPELIRPFLGRVVGAWVAAASGWLTTKVGVGLDPDAQVAAVNVGIGVAFTVYSVVHRLIDAKFNPADAASPVVAETLKREYKPEVL